ACSAAAAVALLCVGCAGGGESGTATSTTSDQRAAEALVAATRRSLEGTWRVEERFERTAKDGRKLTAEQRRVQRPPDRLLVAGGTVDAQRNGRKLACATDAGGALRCSDAGPANPFEEDVDAGGKTLTEQVEGANALHAVSQPHRGCFNLKL